MREREERLGREQRLVIFELANFAMICLSLPRVGLTVTEPKRGLCNFIMSNCAIWSLKLLVDARRMVTKKYIIKTNLIPALRYQYCLWRYVAFDHFMTVLAPS